MQNKFSKIYHINNLVSLFNYFNISPSDSSTDDSDSDETGEIEVKRNLGRQVKDEPKGKNTGLSQTVYMLSAGRLFAIITFYSTLGFDVNFEDAFEKSSSKSGKPN